MDPGGITPQYQVQKCRGTAGTEAEGDVLPASKNQADTNIFLGGRESSAMHGLNGEDNSKAICEITSHVYQVLICNL